MRKRVCIVGGCGRMALPLGVRFAQVGINVTLFDRDPQRVSDVQAGRAPFHEPGLDEALRDVIENGCLGATAECPVLAEQAAVIVAIGTPLDEWLNPDIGCFLRSCGGVADAMRDGQLLVLRSTVMPGATERLVGELADRGRQLHVAYCPDRSAEGLTLAEATKFPQLVGGATPHATHLACQLFRHLGLETIEMSPLEAELGKLFCNAYRYIRFAAANELYVIASRWGVDFERLRRGITHNYSRMADFPKAGLTGGPCLPKDTLQLAVFNLASSPLALAAVTVNEGLPKVLVEQSKLRFDLATMTVGILGMAFKAQSDDPRGSLAYKLRKILRLEARRVLCTDPYIADPELVTLERVLQEADLLFVGAPHSNYRGLRCAQPIVDCFGSFATEGGTLRKAA